MVDHQPEVNRKNKQYYLQANISSKPTNHSKKNCDIEIEIYKSSEKS
jgi:hypothetical protein